MKLFLKILLKNIIYTFFYIFIIIFLIYFNMYIIKIVQLHFGVNIKYTYFFTWCFEAIFFICNFYEYQEKKATNND
jgi:hypothetical protein